MNDAEILKAKGTGVATIGPDHTIGEAVQLLTSHSIGALVVTAGDRDIIGVLSERDVVRLLAALVDGSQIKSTPVTEVMSTPVRTCSPSDRIEGLRILMTQKRIRHLPVADNDGKLCGIVSIGDVVKSRVNELEVEHEQLVEYVRTGQ